MPRVERIGSRLVLTSAFTVALAGCSAGVEGPAPQRSIAPVVIDESVLGAIAAQRGLSREQSLELLSA